MLAHVNLTTNPRPVVIALGIAILAGCAQWPATTDYPSAADRQCDASLSPADRTRLTAIEQLVQEGKFHAAIAQLDALALDTPKATLIRANATRRTNKAADAQALYTTLLGSCYAGQAHHGLGLTMFQQGQDESGLAHLKAARDALPTMPDIRNDYGYALLLRGRLDEAQFELLTALDLAPGHPRASRNAVSLMLKQGKPDHAEAFGRELGLDQSTIDKLKAQTAKLQPNVQDLDHPSP